MSKISEVREELAEVAEAYSEVRGDMLVMIDTVRLAHDDNHAGVFLFCPDSVCRVVRDLELAWL